MPRHFVLAVLVLLLVPGIAQAHKKATRKSHHRAAIAASRRTAGNAVADNARDAEPASSVPLSWLLIILTSVVAVAFVAFTGMCLSPSSQARLAHTSRL